MCAQRPTRRTAHFVVQLSFSILILLSIVHGFSTTTRTTLTRQPSFLTRKIVVSLLSTNNSNNENADTSSTTTTTETGAFVPLNSDNQENFDDDDEEDDDDDDDVLDKVEMFGKGAAKAKRGKRKGSSSSSNTKTPVVKAALVPEEVHYEGPPAVSETFLPTLSILTVVGIIPAAAAWARQAWVRYKITNRRIRVNSGINGNDMSEIIYPDIVEIRTVKRLFGDGDMVCFLRDGAKFEMRNIPEFDTAIEFILQQCNDEVVQQYRSKGDVGRGWEWFTRFIYIYIFTWDMYWFMLPD